MSETPNFYETAHRFVAESFANSPRTIRHLERTEEVVRELKPDTDEALRIAAVSHDIERSERSAVTEDTVTSFVDPDFLKMHQEIGAQLTAAYLSNQNAPTELVERVRDLVSRHEIGGNPDADVLKDADSVSLFEVNAEAFAERHQQKGPEVIREKLDWMFDRIDDPRAREMSRALYEEAIRRLEAR